MTQPKPTFETVIKDHAKLLSRVASTYEANDSIQQELFQEICVAIWQALRAYKGDASIKTFILKVAHNRCVTHVGKEANRFKSHAHEDAASLADQALINSQESLESDFVYSQQLVRLLQSIRNLKLPARQVISLSLEGLSYDEIAQICGMSVSNVGVIINRVKEQLRKEISDER
ncbi:MAG: sigma-70 family RNA polymerase sigma factor [Glaciecola sp.]